MSSRASLGSDGAWLNYAGESNYEVKKGSSTKNLMGQQVDTKVSPLYGKIYALTSGNPCRNNMRGLDLSPRVTQWNLMPFAVMYSWRPSAGSVRQAGGTSLLLR